MPPFSLGLSTLHDLPPQPDVWFALGQTALCVVRALDPDGRSVHSAGRAARVGGALAGAIAEGWEVQDGQFDSEIDEVLLRAVREVDGIFEVLLVVSRPTGVWIGGCGRMEALAPGDAVESPVHRSDTLRWLRPETPEPTAFICTQTITPASQTAPLRWRHIVAPPTELYITFDVPTSSERLAIAERGFAAHFRVRGASGLAAALRLTLRPGGNDGT